MDAHHFLLPPPCRQPEQRHHGKTGPRIKGRLRHGDTPQPPSDNTGGQQRQTRDEIKEPEGRATQIDNDQKEKAQRQQSPTAHAIGEMEKG